MEPSNTSRFNWVNDKIVGTLSILSTQVIVGVANISVDLRFEWSVLLL